jgi:hypothetical protein
MKCVLSLVLGLCLAFTSSHANAALIPLVNTGLSGVGWSLSTSDGGSGSLTTVSNPNLEWGLMPGSNWYSTTSDTQINSSAPGLYTFKYVFNPTALGATNVSSFSFDMLHDDSIVVTLSNSIVGDAQVASGVGKVFIPPTTVNIDPLNIVLDGSNTLTFAVTNLAIGGVNPVGLNVKFNVQDAPAVVPEPASIALWGGICGLGLVVRRFRGKRSSL